MIHLLEKRALVGLTVAVGFSSRNRLQGNISGRKVLNMGWFPQRVSAFTPLHCFFMQSIKPVANGPLNILLRTGKQFRHGRLTCANEFGDLHLSKPARLQVSDFVFPIHALLYRYTDTKAIGMPMYFYIRMPI